MELELEDRKRTTHELGFSITGFSQKNPDTGARIDSTYNASFRKQEISTVLTKVFSDKEGKVSDQALIRVIR